MKHRYNAHRALPAPIIPIRLALPGQRFATRVLSALVDSGADFVIVPERILLRLRSEEANYIRLRGQWSETLEMALHVLDIEIEGRRFPSIDVVADDKENEIILGRNLLNKLVITLNGPKQELEITL